MIRIESKNQLQTMFMFGTFLVAFLALIVSIIELSK
ncbi:putative holin-like toxin [Paenibacillus oenotherae]|uniref:Holin-like toxin n=1 Tax=Paenibacillus oenotherae TaxID=1435645 RepID=A0ABS7D9N7_9BACL|nr:putative holin-like toxin [Paenibacillus oenotherae]